MTEEEYQLEQEMRKQFQQSEMDSYYQELAAWECYMDEIKPKIEDYTSAVYGGFCTEFYQKDLKEWEMKRFCDGPNKPGYYRAKND